MYSQVGVRNIFSNHDKKNHGSLEAESAGLTVFIRNPLCQIKSPLGQIQMMIVSNEECLAVKQNKTKHNKNKQTNKQKKNRIRLEPLISSSLQDFVAAGS